MKNKLNVLLLDGHTVQAFSVAKALRKCDMIVILFYEKKISYGFASRYPHKKIKCPKINKVPAKFTDFLLKYLKENRIDVILPLFDESADIVNLIRKEILSLGTKIGLPPKNQYDFARNKSSLIEFCKINEVPHPVSYSIDETNFKEVAELVGFPSLIKPNSSSGAIGIAHVTSLNELTAYFKNKINGKTGLTLQSFVDNSGYYYNSMVYRTKDGIFSKVVIVKITRFFPVKGGTGSYNETVEYPDIEFLSKKILDRLDWIGFADIDFIVDKNTLEPKIIEINPRIPACIHSALVSGINFPEIIVNDTLGKEIPNQQFIEGKKVRFFAMDVLWFIYSKNRIKVKPSWFNFFSKNLHYQDGCWQDPFTMIAGILMGTLKYLNPSFRKSKLKNT